MRLIFGVLSLLVVAAIVMVLAKQQLQAVGRIRPAQPAAVPGTTPAAAPAPPPTVAEGARQMQQRVADDVTKALQQGAAKRADEQ